MSENLTTTSIDFYPRSPCGERRRHRGNDRCPIHFYPRSPCGERPVQIIIIVVDALISIHALLAESDSMETLSQVVSAISIHALLAESDQRYSPDKTHRRISIHALLAESDGNPAPKLYR